MKLRVGGGDISSAHCVFTVHYCQSVKRGMRKFATVAFVSVVAGVALSGCGASGPPRQRVDSAVRKTLSVTWTRYELALDRPRLLAAPIVVQGGRAAYDFRTGLGYEFFQLQLRKHSYQTLFCDLEPTTFLMAPSPAPAGVLPEGTSWISAPLTNSATDHVLTEQAEALAPALLLEEVSWGAGPASSAGTKVVESVPMAEYRVSVNLKKALSAAMRSGRQAIADAIAQELHATPSGRVSIVVWVNGPGYIGKIESVVPGSGLGTTSFLFSSFTKPYTGARPPASQIVPLASLERGGRSLWTIATGS